MPNSKEPLTNFDKSITLFKKAEEKLSKCNPALLNDVYEGWGEILSDNLLPAINFYLTGSEEMGDRDKLKRADIMMLEFDKWLRKNWNSILLTLNREYGFEITQNNFRES